MSEVKSYLDKEGLATFIDLIKLNFKTRKEAYLDAGLKLSRLTGSSFEYTKNDNAAYNGKICQSTYYVNADKISSFDLGDYICTDPNIMGEVVIQFVPNQDMNIANVSFPNATILWKNEDYIYMSEGETYQIRFTTDNEKRDDGKYLILADLLNYSKWSLPGGGGGDDGGDDGGGGSGDPEKMDNCVCITYKSTSSTIQVLSSNWLNGVFKNYIKGLYYCSDYDPSLKDDDNDFTILTFDDVKKNPNREIKSNSKLIIKFVYGKDIYLKQLLDGITFDTIYFYDLNGNLITDMDYMLANSSNKNITAATSIDFTGIRYVNDEILYTNKCRGLLRNRLTYNPNGMALKMFAGQDNDSSPYDESRGIKFSRLTDMTSMFEGCIRETTGTEANITKMISRIRTANCNNFTYMYKNCYLANADFSGYVMYLSNTMNYTGVFSGATFKDTNQLKTLYNFIVPKDSRGSMDSTTAVTYKEMFMNTNLSDYSSLFWSNNVSECMLWNRNFGSYDFTNMLKGCKNLNKIPIIRLKKSKQVIFDGMFNEACKSVSVPDFSNISKWTVLAGSQVDYKKAPSLSFRDMFRDCNLSKLSSKFEFFTNMSDPQGHTTYDIFIGGSTKGSLAGMFAGSGVKNVKLNLYSTTNNDMLPTDKDDPSWGYGEIAHVLNTSKTMFDTGTYCHVEVSYNSGTAETPEDQWGNLFRLLDKAFYGTNVEIYPIDY